MIGADVLRSGLTSDCLIEHPTNRYAVDVFTLDAKTDDAAGEDVHDEQHPVTAQEDRFAAERIQAPEAVLGLGDQRQPGGPTGSGVARPVVLCEHGAHDIFDVPEGPLAGAGCE